MEEKTIQRKQYVLIDVLKFIMASNFLSNITFHKYFNVLFSHVCDCFYGVMFEERLDYVECLRSLGSGLVNHNLVCVFCLLLYAN